ncbi:hypothetical protein Gekk315_00011 [Aeromonas phage Gekk3-15]
MNNMTNSHLLRIVIVITLLNLAGLVNMQLTMSDIRELRTEYIKQGEQRSEAMNILRGLTSCNNYLEHASTDKDQINEVARRGK